MTQLNVSMNTTAQQTPQRKSHLHDLRDRLNTILTSAMVLERVGAVSPEHQKYLDWILEKANEADELVELISRSDSTTCQ